MKNLYKAYFLVLLVLPFGILAKSFDENIHFISILPEPELGKVGEKIEVIEFFMHGCRHCYNFEPRINIWLKNKADDIAFFQVPALFGRHFNMHGKTYYALEAIGEIERLHDQIFHEIHENKNSLRTRDAMETFLAAKQVDIDKFRQAYNSFAVNTKTNRAETLLKRYDIHGVPSLVIDGRYKSASGLEHGKMTDLIDFLAEKVRQDRQD